MKLLPLLILLLVVSVEAKPRHKPEARYLARIQDIRKRFGYDERDRVWAATDCPRVRINSSYERDTRRLRPAENVELGHKFERLDPNATTGPCIKKSEVTTLASRKNK